MIEEPLSWCHGPLASIKKQASMVTQWFALALATHHWWWQLSNHGTFHFHLFFQHIEEEKKSWLMIKSGQDSWQHAWGKKKKKHNYRLSPSLQALITIDLTPVKMPRKTLPNNKNGSLLYTNVKFMPCLHLVNWWNLKRIGPKILTFFLQLCKQNICIDRMRAVFQF